MSSPAMTISTRSRVHLRPVPAIDPPYDDEIGPRAPIVEGSLALEFPPLRTSTPLRLVPPAVGDVPTAPLDGIPPAPPHPRPWTHRLAQAIVEVLAGDRSAAQLSPFASLDVLEHLERATGRHFQTAGTPTRRPRVSSVHLTEPEQGIVEACAVIETGRRHRALAMRLEEIAGRWRCTALQIG